MELKLCEVFTSLGKLMLSEGLNVSWGRVRATPVGDLEAAESVLHQTPNKEATTILSACYSVWNTTLGHALLFWILNLGIQNSTVSLIPRWNMHTLSTGICFFFFPAHTSEIRALGDGDDAGGGTTLRGKGSKNEIVHSFVEVGHPGRISQLALSIFSKPCSGNVGGAWLHSENPQAGRKWLAYMKKLPGCFCYQEGLGPLAFILHCSLTSCRVKCSHDYSGQQITLVKVCSGFPRATSPVEIHVLLGSSISCG